MATQTGTRTSFNDLVGLKLDLSDMVPLVTSPTDTPFLDLISTIPPTQNAAKHEWLEDTIVDAKDALGGNYTTTQTSITATDFTIYKKGMVLRIDNELFRVSATPTTTTVNVSFGYAGTTNANHNTPVNVTFVGYAITEGADPEQFNTTNRTNQNNLMQVFQEAITVSDFEQWVNTYGVKDKVQYEIGKWLKALRIRLEQTALYSTRFSDSTNNTRIMGGLDQFIVTNPTDESAAALTETMINDEIQDCYTGGGEPSDLLTSPKQARKITGLYGTTSNPVFYNPSGDMTIGRHAGHYQSDFGLLDVTVNRWLFADRIYVLESKNIHLVKGQPFSFEPLAKTGMATKGEITGWYSLEVKAEKHHSLLKNLG
jgi:hypothetical protein